MKLTGSFFFCPYCVVVDENVLLVLGASHCFFEPLQNSTMTRVLHVVLSLSQQQLSRWCIQVLFTPILIVTWKPRPHQKTVVSQWLFFEGAKKCSLKLHCEYNFDLH